MPDKQKLGKNADTAKPGKIKPFNTIKSNSSFATPGTEFKPTNPGTNNQPARETSSDRAKDAVKKVLIGGTIGASSLLAKSPYMMYGKETSPMTMKGGSPLAKYGCSKK